MDVNGISLDATASPQIHALALEGRKSNADVANDYMQGTNAGRGLLTQAPDSNQGLAYGNPMQAAIKQRYLNDYNFEAKKLDNRMLRAASEDHIRNLASTSQMANEEVMQNRQKAALKNEIEQANKRARGAVLGTVLGITGGVAGAYFSGGNAAAGMAGYQAGSGAGQVIGGS